MRISARCEPPQGHAIECSGMWVLSVARGPTRAFRVSGSGGGGPGFRSSRGSLIREKDAVERYVQRDTGPCGRESVGRVVDNPDLPGKVASG